MAKQKITAKQREERIKKAVERERRAEEKRPLRSEQRKFSPLWCA